MPAKKTSSKPPVDPTPTEKNPYPENGDNFMSKAEQDKSNRNYKVK